MDFSVVNKETKLAGGQRAVVVQVVGEVDVYTAPRLKDKLLQVERDDVHQVVVDLSQVGFIDSVGLGVLIGALRRARAGGGTLVLAAPNTRIRRILDITGLSSAFIVVQSVQEGMDALAREAAGTAPAAPQGGS